MCFLTLIQGIVVIFCVWILCGDGLQPGSLLCNVASPAVTVTTTIGRMLSSDARHFVSACLLLELVSGFSFSLNIQAQEVFKCLFVFQEESEENAGTVIPTPPPPLRSSRFWKKETMVFTQRAIQNAVPCSSRSPVSLLLLFFSSSGVL